MFGKNEHIKIFPEGIKEIGNHDEREVLKAHLLERIHSYILKLEEDGLVVKDSKISGSTISFSPERLAEISQDGKVQLTADDVLQVLGVDMGSLKNKEPYVRFSNDGQIKFIRYSTNEPTLYYIQQVGIDNTHYDYFQITDEELQHFAYTQSSPAMKELAKNQAARLRGESV